MSASLTNADHTAGVTAERDLLSKEDAIYSRVTWRLLPVLFISYVIAYVDRVNVGFAKLQMLHDLGFSEAAYGLGAGIFFIGYCSSEVPANLMLARLGARRWISQIMVAWGLLSAGTLFIHSTAAFYVMRCLLGVAEAGLFPGVIFYLTCWYPSHRRGRIVALFMAAQPVAGVIGAPLSGWILERFHGVGILAGWQWLFLLEALPAIVMGIVFFYRMDDGIDDAQWLSVDEKLVLKRHLDSEHAHKQAHASILSLLRNSKVWLLSAITFSSVLSLYGINFWLPSIIKALGVARPLHIGLLTMVPYGAAIVVMLLASRSADRSGERRWHLALSTIFGAAGLIATALLSGNVALSMAALTLATASIITSQPLFWSLPTAFLGGTAAAAGIAFINMAGNSAGFFSPYLVGWIVQLTGKTTIAMYVLATSLLIGSALTLFIPASLVNGRRTR